MAEDKATGGWLGRHRRLLLFGGPILIAASAAAAHFAGRNTAATDDAYVRSARIDISPSISGKVVEIDVRDNQEVREGEVLFRLDDRDAALAVSQAEAALAAEKLRISAMKAAYRKQSAQALAAKTRLDYLDHEWRRQKSLASKGIATGEALDAARHQLDMAKLALDAALEEQENVRASLGGDPAIEVDRHPEVKLAKARLDRAKLDLAYKTVTAPADGIVTRVENLGKGDYLKPGAPVFSLLSKQDFWIEANFRETDLGRIRPGEKAEIAIDAYPGERFQGAVESLSPGTGSSFSVLPVENATGNWVKVVQRLPVRIGLKSPHPLRAGLSATVRVELGK